jgi:hypothetical protein
MPVDTHEVVFSFEQPGDARNPLLLTLQQLRNRPVARDSRATALLGAQRVLIIDSQQERAQYIAHLLSAASYWPFVAPTPLDAYTLFLQGSFHPFAIVLSDDNTDNQFFLTRLSQQFVQRYDWKVPFIRLRVAPSSEIGPRSTEPLAQGQTFPRPTTPLNEPEKGIRRNPSSAPLPQQPAVPPIPRPAEQPRRSSLSGRLTPWSGEQQPRPSGSLPAIQPKRQAEKISLDGLTIGRIQIKGVIGGNPLGDVYLAYDRAQNQNMALKIIQTNLIPLRVLDSSEDENNLFQRELDLLKQAQHPHIARVLNIGRSYRGEVQFIYKMMPYYEEGSLAKWLRQYGGRAFVPADVARVIAQLADAVQFLHNRGVLYQNFKASNILIANETANMRDLQVVLTDLPIVPDMLNLPKTSEAYRYFAPEQWEGEAFTSSDQYGLAVIAYELLAGRAPFQGNSEGIMRRMHLTMAVPVPSSFNQKLSPFIDKVLLRALSKEPNERFESVSAFAIALEQASN